MILDKLFAQTPQHPLADPKELKRILAELPVDNAYKTIDEIAGWFESLEQVDGFRTDRLADVVNQLDLVAQPAIRKLTREFLTSPRLSRSDERRIWTTAFQFWQRLALLNGRVVQAALAGDKGSDALKPLLPLCLTRQISALVASFKWLNFQHRAAGKEFWRHIGKLYLVAVDNKIATRPVTMFPGTATTTTSTPEQEYLKALLLSASSLDSLHPMEIELAAKLIAHFLPRFAMAGGEIPGMLYWVDAAQGAGPQRLATSPSASPSLRLIAPGTAPDELAAMLRLVERGNIPDELNLGGQYPARTLVKVLRHLALYWAPQPPMRQHKRHPVKSMLSVLHGFDACADILDPAVISPPEVTERWSVDNVSLGGFGASVEPVRDDWLRIGTLVCLRPDGGDNWLLGAVRRYGRQGDTMASIGVQTLARKATALDFRPRTTGSYTSPLSLRGILLHEEMPGDEVRVVLPATAFDLRESLDGVLEGRRVLLMPVVCEESCSDFDLGRYRLRYAE